jgi:hypothetical protein
MSYLHNTIVGPGNVLLRKCSVSFKLDDLNCPAVVAVDFDIAPSDFFNVKHY